MTDTKEKIIEQTVHILEQLSVKRAAAILDYAEFLSKRRAARKARAVASQEPSLDDFLRANLPRLAQCSTSFSFLEDEPDLYSIDDIVEPA